MKVIAQNGAERDMTAFGFTQGGGKWAVTGQLTSEPFMYRRSYTIGVYGDRETATVIVARLVQHKGEEPFKMPPEDTVLALEDI